MNYKKVTAILSAKGATFRFLLMGLSKNEALEKLNNSVTYDRGVLQICPNKTTIDVIRKGAFGGTDFRDIYSGINEKWHKHSWKEFVQIKNIDAKFYASDYFNVNVNKYVVSSGTSTKFWEIRAGLMKEILMVGFSGILGTG